MAVTDWFDPQTWLRQLPDPLNMRGFLQDGVRIWLNEFASLARDRPVHIRRGDSTVDATLRYVKLHPTASPGSMVTPDAGFDALDRAVLVFDDVVWNGHRIDRIDVVVEDVRVSRLPRRRIRGGPVTLQLKVPVATLAAWLATANITLVDDPGAGDQVLTVQYRWRRVPFEARVVPAVTSSAAVFAIRELRVRGRRVPLPSRFDLGLSVPVSLDDGVRLRDAAVVDADTIAVEIQVRRIDYPVSMQQLLDHLSGPTSVLDVAG